MTPKLIYFAQRHPSLGPEAFVARWRAHGALGMSLPRWRNIMHYTQAHAIDRGTLRMEDGSPCDGVAAVTFHSEAARLAHVADPDAATTRADEATTFAGPVARSAHLVREVQVLPHHLESFKVYFRIFPPDDASADQLVSHWHGSIGRCSAAALRAFDPDAGYSQNHLRGAIDGARTAPTPAIIDEVSFGRRSAASAWVGRYLTLFAEGGMPKIRVDWVAVRETVLWPSGDHM